MTTIQYSEPVLARLQAIWGEGFLSPGGPEEVSRIVDGLDLAGKKILDIGFGTGGPTVRLVTAHGAGHVTGIDVEEDLRRHAQRHADASGVSHRVEFRTVEPGPLPFGDARFDIVFSKDSIIHVADKRGLFENIARVLKPNGLFTGSDWLVSDDPASVPSVARYKNTVSIRYELATAQEMERIMRSAGLVDVISRDNNAWFTDVTAEEVRRIEGPLRPSLIAKIGEDAYEKWLITRRALADAAAAGGMRPTYLRGRKRPESRV